MILVFAHRNARALYDCEAEDEPIELSFKRNEILYDGKKFNTKVLWIQNSSLQYSSTLHSTLY